MTEPSSEREGTTEWSEEGDEESRFNCREGKIIFLCFNFLLIKFLLKILIIKPIFLPNT